MLNKVLKRWTKQETVFVDLTGEEYILLCEGKRVVFLRAKGNRVERINRELIVDIDVFLKDYRLKE